MWRERNGREHKIWSFGQILFLLVGRIVFNSLVSVVVVLPNTAGPCIHTSFNPLNAVHSWNFTGRKQGSVVLDEDTMYVSFMDFYTILL